jgi:hypothetical protein
MDFIKYVFAVNEDKYDGIRPINIYLMRMIYVLMFFVMGKDVWTEIFTHNNVWEPTEAMAWSVWAAFSAMALIGIFRTVQMIPILLLEIFYKILWLVIVALPLWRTDQLAGYPAEGMTQAFLWVLLPIIALPWRYVFNHYIVAKKTADQ